MKFKGYFIKVKSFNNKWFICKINKLKYLDKTLNKVS